MHSPHYIMQCIPFIPADTDRYKRNSVSHHFNKQLLNSQANNLYSIFRMSQNSGNPSHPSTNGGGDRSSAAAPTNAAAPAGATTPANTSTPVNNNTPQNPDTVMVDSSPLTTMEILENENGMDLDSDAAANSRE
jgi:hypothetical protein